MNTAIALIPLLPCILTAPAPASNASMDDAVTDELIDNFDASYNATSNDYEQIAFDDDDVLIDDLEDSDFDDEQFESNTSRQWARGNSDNLDFESDDAFSEDFLTKSSKTANANAEKSKPASAMKPVPTTYNILVKTGDKYFSGSSAHIFIQLSDVNGNQVFSFLSPRSGHFSRSKIELFKISTNKKLDEVCSITLGSDLKGFAFPQWYTTVYVLILGMLSL